MVAIHPPPANSFSTADIQHVLDYAWTGLCVIPVASDGSKRPQYAWKEYQQRRPTVAELKQWFVPATPLGAGVVCGVPSGGLEVFDFDHDADEVFAAWESEVSEIICRLPVVETPKFGRHVYFRCQEFCGNSKLAYSKSGEVRIETRGQGGYVVSPISPSAVHPTGRPYIQVAGPVLGRYPVPAVTKDERRQLWQAARKFDQAGTREKEVKRLIARNRPRRQESADDGPWDRFNRRADWVDWLTKYGWHSGDGIHWTRPGKRFGHSATLRETADGQAVVLHVFSSNTLMEPNKSHDLFGFYAAHAHGGDRSAAAKELIRQGYGKQEVTA